MDLRLLSRPAFFLRASLACSLTVTVSLSLSLRMLSAALVLINKPISELEQPIDMFNDIRFKVVFVQQRLSIFAGHVSAGFPL